MSSEKKSLRRVWEKIKTVFFSNKRDKQDTLSSKEKYGPPLSKEAYDAVYGDTYLKNYEIQQLVEGNGERNVLGIGGESVVVENGNAAVGLVHLKNSELRRVDSLRALEVFHAHRIFSTLFPHNFPAISLAENGPHGRTVRSKVILRSDVTTKVKFPMQDVYQKCRKFSVPMPTMDPNDFNYPIGADGGEYYVDLLYVTAQFFSKELEENMQKLMDNLHLDKKEQEKVRSEYDIRD